MKTIQLTLDDELFEQVEQAVSQQQTTLPDFIKLSGNLYLRKIKTKEFEKLHRGGYRKNPVKPGEFDVWEEEQVWSDG